MVLEIEFAVVYAWGDGFDAGVQNDEN
jgi:hypothetical protein